MQGLGRQVCFGQQLVISAKTILFFFSTKNIVKFQILTFEILTER